ncbi:molecular chaperone [Aurantiacibacter atlanticus]|uniref:Molecular chaperone n=1 Tax=Aurantiacibacter atlanticus TaxID=1648404 RepID=A0A0H4VZR6_9SPHN|nr:ATP12 family protein [Aurantiacibacter atlanticus]AKQ42678.1 molecular chaperone [Aurantiacibacter atlanticus]MDF1835458.1 molecular chaperone [Alteraurantiacibacter sp. bin_em_oilr2.035]
MKRFYRDVTIAQDESGWRALLDERPIRTQGLSTPQTVPTKAAAKLLAEEWQSQGEEIDARSFFHRDLADFALDMVRPERAATIDQLLDYAGTDTLCYRADPGELLFQRQQDMWEPLVNACEARHAIRLERVSGIIHHAQPSTTIATLRERLEGEDDFTLAASVTLASLAASLVVALAVLEEDADIPALFAAGNAEEDWQAELWGWDSLAQEDRIARLTAFEKAAVFARAVRA